MSRISFCSLAFALALFHIGFVEFCKAVCTSTCSDGMTCRAKLENTDDDSLTCASLERLFGCDCTGCNCDTSSARILADSVMDAEAKGRAITVSKVKKDDEESLHKTAVTASTKNFTGWVQVYTPGSSKLLCDRLNVGKKYHPRFITKYDTVEKCRDACLKLVKDCDAVNYLPKTRNCYFLNCDGIANVHQKYKNAMHHDHFVSSVFVRPSACKEGYFQYGYKGPCKPKKCYCTTGGVAATGKDCLVHGQDKCMSCSKEYNFDPVHHRCHLKSCDAVKPCKNGHAGWLDSRGRLRCICVKCNPGFFLEEKKGVHYESKCTEKKCTCNHGLGATGTDCPKQGAPKCTACDEGYFQDPHNQCSSKKFAARGCADLVYRHDGHCDDGNNNRVCGWDGGDCCAKVVSELFCEVCKCLDPKSTFFSKEKKSTSTSPPKKTRSTSWLRRITRRTTTTSTTTSSVTETRPTSSTTTIRRETTSTTTSSSTSTTTAENVVVVKG